MTNATDDRGLQPEFFEALAGVPNMRSVGFLDVEMTSTGNGFKFDGIAAPTGVSADLGEFTEDYQKGMFRRFLGSCTDNIPFLHEHNPRDLLATTRSGRLKLSEDNKGLRANADVVKTDLSERIKALVDSGDIGGMSIGMVVGADNSKITLRSGRPHRHIINIKRLLDVCTTFDPAYVSTEAQFRSTLMQFADSPESMQQILLGAYPQFQAQGIDDDDTNEDEAPADTTDVPDGEQPDVGEGEDARVTEQRRLSIATRRRALSLYLLEMGDPQK